MLVDEKAAAQMLGVSARTLQRWRTTGGGPVFARVGPRLVRYQRSDIETFAAQGCADSLADERGRAAQPPRTAEAA